MKQIIFRIQINQVGFGSYNVELPKGSRILSFGIFGESVNAIVYAMGDPTAPKVQRSILLLPTGEPFDVAGKNGEPTEIEALENLKFISTVVLTQKSSAPPLIMNPLDKNQGSAIQLLEFHLFDGGEL